MRTTAKLFWQIACILVFSSLLGAGFGFIQGVAAFAHLPIEQKLGLSAWAALTGIGVSVLLGPILYFGVIRNQVSLEALGQVLLIAFIIGVSTAALLGAVLDGGWLSCFVTPVAVVLLTIAFRLRSRHTNREN
ncbi:hypothetical protein [Pedosphaera parvula]|uniref:Uncharacterized protein n=1 Tax=Pedosphaera parvula (strain Ellin514) TaxID=320771 RepID=B9XHD9_PEDPL|nr:hypothetical protein [Pedosphaera parvula]EEF60774.1 conserved hypothetical protein [Pedosphaera parvula Ellin514]